MGHKYNVKGVTHSDEPKENNHPNAAVPLGSTKRFSSAHCFGFTAATLLFWFSLTAAHDQFLQVQQCNINKHFFFYLLIQLQELICTEQDILQLNKINLPVLSNFCTSVSCYLLDCCYCTDIFLLHVFYPL